MSVIHPGLYLIMQQFPAQKNLLRRLYLSNDVFQTVCRDYQMCENARTHWEQSTEDCALERYCEYEELQQSLEQEIEEFLRQEQKRSTHGLNW